MDFKPLIAVLLAYPKMPAPWQYRSCLSVMFTSVSPLPRTKLVWLSGQWTQMYTLLKKDIEQKPWDAVRAVLGKISSRKCLQLKRYHIKSMNSKLADERNLQKLEIKQQKSKSMKVKVGFLKRSSKLTSLWLDWQKDINC